MTSANEKLRRLLDELGVEWKAFDDFEQTTQWSTHNGAFVYWARERDGKLLVETTASTKCSASCTPEQAIAATLGATDAKPTQAESSGTCHDKNGFDPELGFECTVCGAMTDGYMLTTEDTGHYTQFNFCPMCGRRIEQ